MSNIFSASVGKKLIMSISGLFLIVFLIVHLTANLLLLIGEDAFNIGAHFMGTNPIIRIVEPLLGLGFVIHILYASILTLKNQSARPQNYSTVHRSNSSKWASRNMYILGGTVLTFLVIHIINFYWKIKFGGEHALQLTTVDGVEMHNSYLLVSSLFATWWYAIIYVIGAIFLGLHLSHGFWSSFQSVGFSNDKWRGLLSIVGNIYAFIIAFGFSIIPLYFLFFN